GTGDVEGGHARIAHGVLGEPAGDLLAHPLALEEQLVELGGLGAVVEGGHELDRLAEVLQVCLQLGGEVGIEGHGGRRLSGEGGGGGRERGGTRWSPSPA